MERFLEKNYKHKSNRAQDWKSNKEKKVTNYLLSRNVTIIRLIAV